MSALCLTNTFYLSSTWHQFQVALATTFFDIPSGSHHSCHPHPSTAKLISIPSNKINKLKSIPQQAPSIIAGQRIANLLSIHKSAGGCMGLAETTYKGNQSGKSVDVDSGVALYCEPRRSRHVRDRGGRARQISHKTSGGQTMSPCADPAYGEQGPAKLSRHKAAKPLNLDHAAKPRSHKATCRHCPLALLNATKPQKTQNVVEFERTKGAAKASRNTLACMAGHEPRLWCFSSLWRFETL